MIPLRPPKGKRISSLAGGIHGATELSQRINSAHYRYDYQFKDKERVLTSVEIVRVPSSGEIRA